MKHFARQRKINEPFRGTLSSYAYVLLVIQYLQSLKYCLCFTCARGRPAYLYLSRSSRRRWLGRRFCQVCSVCLTPSQPRSGCPQASFVVYVVNDSQDDVNGMDCSYLKLIPPYPVSNNRATIADLLVFITIAVSGSGLSSGNAADWFPATVRARFRLSLQGRQRPQRR